MGRLSKELLEQIRKNPPTYWHGSRGITLFEHIDAIELELKISKEDEESIARAAVRMTENIAELQMQLNNARAENGKLKNKLNIGRELAEEYVQHIDQLKIKLHNANLENTGLKSEVDRYRGEIRTLRDLVDEKAKDERRMFERYEKLQRELDEAREPKKVVLPEEVAEAIEDFKERGDDVDYIVYCLGEPFTSPRVITLQEYAKNNGFNLISALLNGYTVEQTKEERLREGIAKAVTNLIESKTAPESNELKIKMLADGVTAFVTKFNAEN